MRIQWSAKQVCRVMLSGVAAAMLIGVAGCADNGTGGGGTTVSIPASGLAAGGASSFYALQQPQATQTAPAAPATLLQYGLTSSGAISPTGTLIAPSGVEFNAVATDSAGTIYVGAYNASLQGEILVYPAGSTGAATPTRTILGAAYSAANTSVTTFTIPASMVVSPNGMLYVLGFDYYGNLSVASFPASTPSSTVTPTTLIFGTSTQMVSPNSMTADAAGNVYVSNETSAYTGSILVFASGSTGNATPTRVITSASVPYGVDVDTSGNVYAALEPLSVTSPGSIVKYAAGANGAATPVNTIAGSTTSIFYGGGLRVDAAGNIYIVNQDTTGTVFSVLGFSPTATGNVKPNLSFTSSAYNSPEGEIAIH